MQIQNQAVEINPQVISAFNRQMELVQARTLYVHSVLSDADRMHIPYKEGIQHADKFNKFACDVSIYESLLSDAQDRNLDWDIGTYDPVGLEQAIEEYDNKEYKASNASYFDYQLALGVGA